VGAGVEGAQAAHKNNTTSAAAFVVLPMKRLLSAFSKTALGSCPKPLNIFTEAHINQQSEQDRINRVFPRDDLLRYKDDHPRNRQPEHEQHGDRYATGQ